MLKSKLLHPDILSVIGRCGHHAKILIADGNYPASSKIGPRAELVCLQLSPGVPTVAQVLDAILDALPIDFINTMGIDPTDPYASAGDPASGMSFDASSVPRAAKCSWNRSSNGTSTKR